MANPCARPAEPHTPLGVDSGEQFILAADGEVYRYDGIYWRAYRSLVGWRSCSTAKRIASREADSAREKRRAREAVAMERARMLERRK